MALASQGAIRHGALTLSRLARKTLDPCNSSAFRTGFQSVFSSVSCFSSRSHPGKQDANTRRLRVAGVTSFLQKSRTVPPLHRCQTSVAQSSRTGAEAATLEAESKPSSALKSHTSEKPSWKAAIDFKFIRDNVDLIKRNIDERKSGGDAANVVALYDHFVKIKTVSFNLCLREKVFLRTVKMFSGL